ncbi:hypothetical protein [Nocardioides speluncae]|uniref:hypothetical protein n=1 Tax=Nocardioides speluncae TaxID=2670337 RepID=UPI000D69971A|nr:hypothetical protein [Nocardioides speluncae]
MTAWQEYAAALGEVAKARAGARQEQDQMAGRLIKDREAAAAQVKATEERRQHIDRQAAGLTEHAGRTLADAGVRAEGRRTEVEVTTPTSLEDAKKQMDGLAAQLTQTADQLQQARAQASMTRTRWQQVAAYVGLPLLAGAWGWWVGREPTEAAATFVLVAFAMWTVRKATTGKARPFAVGVAAFVATALCIFAVDAFVPTGTMVYFAVLFVLIAWRFLTLQVRGGRTSPDLKK